jgi:hypothetical protein
LQPRAARPQAPREHREVEDERRVRERQLGEIDDDVAPAHEGAGEGAATARLRRPHLVSAAAQDGRVVVEADDGREATR